MVAALIPLLAVAVSTASVGWFFAPFVAIVIFGLPVALGFITAGVLRLCHPILSGWGWILVVMCVAVSIVVCGVGYVVYLALVVNEIIRLEGVIPAYVILLLVNVLVQAVGANLLADKRRRRLGVAA